MQNVDLFYHSLTYNKSLENETNSKLNQVTLSLLVFYVIYNNLEAINFLYPKNKMLKIMVWVEALSIKNSSIIQLLYAYISFQSHIS